MKYCIYFFIIGAFVGWMLECISKFASQNMKRTPGILNTPFCILYGLGTVVLSVIINNITNNFTLLFILSMLVLSVMEYITFILLKKIYGLKLWDYTNMKFNIEGKVCLGFSIMWGILGALYIKFLLPALNTFYFTASGVALNFAIYLLFIIIMVDFIYSSHILINRKRYSLREES